MIRHPAVAGTFYSASPELLRAEVAKTCVPGIPRIESIAVVSPHAGYKYSGSVAGAVFSRINIPERVIMVGPNHTGIGPALSIFPEGIWVIPGTEVPVDSALAHALLAKAPGAEADTAAHAYEHSLEVQVPFLDHVRRNALPNEHDSPVRIVPILLGTTSKHVCRSLGLALAAVIREHVAQGHRAPLLVASTDMNHYESDLITRRKDRLAIDAIQQLDPDGLADAVHEHGISMCGAGPTIAVLHAARELGATGATLVRYATSGEVSLDLQRVVGYASFIIT